MSDDYIDEMAKVVVKNLSERPYECGGVLLPNNNLGWVLADRILAWHCVPGLEYVPTQKKMTIEGRGSTVLFLSVADYYRMCGFQLHWAIADRSIQTAHPQVFDLFKTRVVLGDSPTVEFV